MRSFTRYSIIFLLLVICNFPADVYCQAKENASEAYSAAIGEYIKAAYGKGIARPDTLFIGKNVDMPDIKLPVSIGGINTVLVTNDVAKKKIAYRKSLVYLNVIGWIEKNKSEFMIVTFYEFKPQYNCSMHFKRNTATNKMELESLKFEYPYGQKKRMQQD